MKKFFYIFLIAFLILSCQTDIPQLDNTPPKFTVIFDSNGGSKVSSQVVEKGKSVTKPEDPLKDDYNFGGWFKGESIFNFSTPINSDLTLKAEWNKKTFTVIFDSDGGSEVASQNIEIKSTITKPEDPTKEEYIFLGWYFAGSLFDFSTPISTNITLKAKWDRPSSQTIPEEQKQFFTVTFNSNGGSETVSQEIENGKTATKPEDAVRDGYDFNGWFIGDILFDFTTPITANITLTAKWTEKQKQFFTVTFNSNGGSGTVSQKIENGKTATKPENPYKERCSFIGWFIGENKFDFSTPITSDITLEAKWEGQVFIVSFDSDGGTGISNTTVQDGNTITKPSNPSKTNYTFIGWFNGESEFDFSSPITSNITLKAKWEKKLTVTFDYNGAKSNEETIVDKGSLITSQTASWTKHKFLGWYNGDTLFDFSTPIISDITLTAKWLKTCTVRFVYNDPGNNIMIKDIDEGQCITDDILITERTGYSFAGWYLNGQVFNLENTVITEDIELNGKWYCDSVNSELCMEHGWGWAEDISSYTIFRAPLYTVVACSSDGTPLNYRSLSGIWYLNDRWLENNVYANDNFEIRQSDMVYRGYLKLHRIDNKLYVEKDKDRTAYPYFNDHFSLLKVERYGTEKNKWGNEVDSIYIYIYIDF